MASKLLPQGFVLVTCGNNVAPQFPPIKKQLGFQLNSFSQLSLSNRKDSSIFSAASRSFGVTRCEGGGSDGGAVVVEESTEEPTSEAVESVPWKPRVKLGDVMGEVPENKRRLSLYKGIVISRQNAGIHTTIRVRRIIAGVGVEIVFPLYSPNIKEIKVVKHRKVRKARLYYLRDKLPRLSTFK
ncbi:hypothetical protein KSS87_005035 [Heliosperma pusillum]|nr:hypothetical protein KSS87_005035 [Heliosperma pusillum]